jgi:gliding motility-associated-like protein
MKKNLLLLFAFFLVTAGGLKAQSEKTKHISLDASLVNSFYDTEDAKGNYENNQNHTYTIYSKNGQSPYVSFTAFTTEKAFDIMYIYDGGSTSSRLIGSYSGGDNPGTIMASGKELTIVFTSDASGTASGWAATIGYGKIAGRGTLPSVASASNCADADPFCTGTAYSFPASTNVTAQTGPDYGCLGSEPNPAWYYLQIANSGNLVLSISGSSGNDVDFICWGPFTSPSTACTGITVSGNIVDCSYSASATETCTIPNGVTGQYYMVLITNFSNVAQNIDFSQVGGSGSTNCSIVTCTLAASNTGPYCVGQTISLSATAVTGGTYSWSGPGGYSSTAQNPTRGGATAAMSGTYTVTCTTSSSTCTATTAVTVSASPTVTVNSPTICRGASTTLTASGATTYSWSPSTGLSATTGASVTASPTVTTTYTIVGTTGSCTASATSLVTVNPLPTVTVGSATICPGSSTVLTASGASTYTWAPSATLSSSTGTSVTASPGSTTVYTITGTSASGCTGTTTATVTIGGAITPSVASATICNGSSTTLTATGATTYTWSPPTGLSATTGASVTANPSSTTTYTINAASGACTGTTTAVVTVNPIPTVTVNSSNICIGASTTLNASGATTYSWSPATGLSATTGASVTANPTVTTTYTIVGTSSTCTSSATSIVTVNPLPTVTVNSATICPSSSAVLTATGASTYTWSPSATLSSSTGTSVTASPASTTSYTINATSAAGCTTTATCTVTVGAGVTPSVASATICSGSSTTLTATGATTYTWSPPTGLSATTGASVTANPTSTTTYTINAASGACTGTTTAVVTVNPMPTVTVNSPSICIGASTTLNAAGATTYSWSPATGLSATTGASVTANPTVTTTYTVTGTSTGCTSTATSILTINPLPVITANAATICGGGSATITAGGASTYAWSPGTGLSATTGASVTANPATTTQYTITGTDANGCVNSDTTTVTVVSNPTVTVNTATICLGQQTATLTAAGAATYVWSPPTGLSSTTGATVNATPAGTTTYTVTGTAGTCTATATTIVTVNALPIITVNTATICVGQQTATLTAGGAITYTWSPATGLSSANGSPVTSTVSATTPYTVTATDPNGCINFNTTTVTVNALPIVNLSGALICFGASTTLNAAGASTYSWSPGTGLSATTGASVTANPVTTTQYTVVGVDANGCINADTAIVTVVNNPTVTVNTGTICLGQQIAMLNANGATTYAWSPATGLSATTGSTVAATPGATTTYTVTGTLGTCTSTATTTVTVNPLPVLTIGSSSPVCVNQTLNFNSAGGTIYAWSGPNSFSSTQPNPSISGISLAANGTYSLTVTDANTCVNTATVSVIVNPLPVVTATGSTVCLNATINLTATGGTGYSWSGPLGYSSSQQSPSRPNATAGMAGSYVVTVTDANNCVNANVAQVVLNPFPVVTVNSATICAGNSATLSATGASIYSWTPVTGLSSSTGASVNASPGTTTTYSVIGTDVNGCKDTVVTSVSVNTAAPLSITPSISSGCAPVCVSFTNTTAATGTCNWVFGDGTTSTNCAPSHCFALQGNYITLFTMTDANGCKRTDTSYTTVYPMPTADFSFNPQPTTILDPVIYFTNLSGGAFIPTVKWTFGDPAHTASTLSNPSFSYLDPGSFAVQLAVTTNHGCKDSITKTVVIMEDYFMYVPNAFTPNQDGVNETFFAKGEGIKDFRMYIFDRWGNQVFYSDDILKGWDGRFMSKGDNVLQEDVYVWKIELKTFKNEPKMLKGTVSLLK